MMTNDIQTEVDKNIVRIRAYIRESGLSNLRFANMADVKESTIRRLFKPDFDPRITTLRKLEAVIPADYQPTELNKPSTG